MPPKKKAPIGDPDHAFPKDIDRLLNNTAAREKRKHVEKARNAYDRTLLVGKAKRLPIEQIMDLCNVSRESITEARKLFTTTRMGRIVDGKDVPTEDDIKNIAYDYDMQGERDKFIESGLEYIKHCKERKTADPTAVVSTTAPADDPTAVVSTTAPADDPTAAVSTTAPVAGASWRCAKAKAVLDTMRASRTFDKRNLSIAIGNPANLHTSTNSDIIPLTLSCLSGTCGFGRIFGQLRGASEAPTAKSDIDKLMNKLIATKAEREEFEKELQADGAVITDEQPHERKSQKGYHIKKGGYHNKQSR